MSAPSTSSKVQSLAEVVAWRDGLRADGLRLVHCHGCFDIVHPGHVRHLQHARELGDRLLVTITPDAFVNKGAGRPYFDESLRAENLAALACVDGVVVNDSATAEPLLRAVRPDVYVKGAEYEFNQDPRFAAERAAVEAHGGRVVFSSGEVVFSSSALIDSLDGTGGSDPATRTLRRLRTTHGLTLDRLGAMFGSFVGRRVLVIGEPIVDSYVECAWPEVTGEAPILSLRPVSRVRFDGGAAVIARHLAAMGAAPTLLTALPRSAEGEAMCERLGEAGVSVCRIDVETPIAEKERLMVGREKLVKLDRSVPIELDASGRLSLVERAVEIAIECDAAIVADYGLGMLGPGTTARLFEALRPLVGTLAGDVSGGRASLLAMRGADWLCPAERELRAVMADPSASLPAVAAALIERTDAAHVAVTMASDGVVAFTATDGAESHDGQAHRLVGEHVPAMSSAPVDTLGCGDALLAAAVLALTSGVGSVTAGYIGSLAAAACAGRAGNRAVSCDDLLSVAHGMEPASVRVAAWRDTAAATG